MYQFDFEVCTELILRFVLVVVDGGQLGVDGVVRTRCRRSWYVMNWEYEIFLNVEG